MDANNNTNEADHLWRFALECWNNALEVYRSLLGESHERVADVQNNRGIALGKLRLYREALEALEMALEARKRQQRHRRVAKNNEHKNTAGTSTATTLANGSSSNAAAKAAASTTDAIVSTLHNIANVHRDAGQPYRALEALVEARGLLQTQSTEHDPRCRRGNNGSSSCGCSCGCPFRLRLRFHRQHRHHCWHQSARLSTAIGHVHYELQSWRDARNSYLEALQVYETLSRALSSEESKNEQEQQQPGRTNGNGSCCHGNEHGVQVHETRQQRQQRQRQHQDERNLLQHQHESIQREVSVLEEDLDELDRRQQAAEGSRTRLLRVRRQEQQRRSNACSNNSTRVLSRRAHQERQQCSPGGESDQAPSQQQHDHQAMLLSFVQHLRA